MPGFLKRIGVMHVDCLCFSSLAGLLPVARAVAMLYLLLPSIDATIRRELGKLA